MTVVMAARGYPGAYDKGSVIGGLRDLPASSEQMVFHAGTGGENGQFVAMGGRVLNATARGPSLGAARDRAYGAGGCG